MEELADDGWWKSYAQVTLGQQQSGSPANAGLLLLHFVTEPTERCSRSRAPVNLVQHLAQGNSGKRKFECHGPVLHNFAIEPSRDTAESRIAQDGALRIR